MKAEVRRRLLQLASGQKHGVTGVSGVTALARNGRETRETPETRVSLLSRPKPSRQAWSREDWIGYFHERAAVREFEGGLARASAERLAVEDMISQWLAFHPALPTAPQAGCVHCGKPEDPQNPL